MLKLEHVSKYYNNRGVTTKGLDDISVEFNKGEVVAITGESGSGKSTLLNVISRLDTFDDGEIYFKGNETSYFNVLDMDQFRKNKISFVFQNYNIIESYTVLENVMLPLLINGENKVEAKKKALEILDKVGLTKRANNRGTQLSGGEKQRTVIARALALDTPIIACDEPTGNLDQKTGREIIELICELSKDKLVLIVTHNFDELKDLATRKIKIHDGKIVEDIKFREFENDQNEELNLDYVPISRKVDFRIATSNLISTPKKTIFTFLIFMVIAFFSLNIFQNIMTDANTTTAAYRFNYHNDKKFQVYDENYKALDVDKLKKVGTVIENPFYERTSFYLERVTSENYYYNSGINAIYESYVEGEITDGKEPQNDNEFVLYMPYTTTYYEVGQIYKIKKESKLFSNSLNSAVDTSNLEDTTFTISGIGYSDYISGPVITKCAKLEEYARFNAVKDMDLDDHSDTFSLQNYMVYYNFDDVTHIANYNETTAIDLDKIYLREFNYNLFNLGAIPCDTTKNETYLKYKMTYELTACENAIVIGYDYYQYFTDTYEASVYISKKSDIKKLDELGYKYYASDITNNSSNIIDDLAIYFSIVTSAVLIVILYFISYVILRKVYETKNESYTIFRTLGVNIDDMKKISLYEILILSVISTTFVYVLMTILGKIFKYKTFFKLFSNISPLITIIYFICTILMSVLIAIKFNKKLFKKSVKESLKEAK